MLPVALVVPASSAQLVRSCLERANVIAQFTAVVSCGCGREKGMCMLQWRWWCWSAVLSCSEQANMTAQFTPVVRDSQLWHGSSTVIVHIGCDSSREWLHAAECR
jgi:hypothetical protein